MGVDVEASADPAALGADVNSREPVQPALCDSSEWPAQSATGSTRTVNLGEESAGFSVSTPQAYSQFWARGTSPDELVELARARDEAWTERWEQRLRSGNENPKAVAVDEDRSTELVAVIVTLTPAEGESGDDLAAVFAGGYQGVGFGVGEACGVTLNGADGAYVEHTVPAPAEGLPHRTQLQFLIPDAPNDVLWGMTCDVPESIASEVKRQCAQMASTFRPLP